MFVKILLSLHLCAFPRIAHAFTCQSVPTRKDTESPVTVMAALPDRRAFLYSVAAAVPLIAASAAAVADTTPPVADQFDPDDPNNDPEIREIYDNQAMPQAPEERSGLVVLRVAEVAQFQEKILRAVVSGDLKDVMVSPMQFAFGTQILLRNSNLDGNMKLMISDEIPRKSRPLAAKNAAATMNLLQEIGQYSASIQRDFEPFEMLYLADLYLKVRVNLNELYEYLPQKEKDKYDGYFAAVTEYEKKIANGTYNPDIDGVLKFD